MAKGQNQKAKLDNDVMEQPQDLIAPPSDDDDREANEDLSLKIVETSTIDRCTLEPDVAVVAAAATTGSAEGKNSKKTKAIEVDSEKTSTIDRCTLEPDVAVVVVAAATTGSDEGNNSKKTKAFEGDSEKTSTSDICTLEPEVVVVVAAATTAATVNGEGKKEIVPETEEETKTITKVDSDENDVAVELSGHNAVETYDDTVVQKLLRGPRYFDPPDSAWETCYNCGEEGHMTIDCPTVTKWKKKKACYICASLGHRGKKCSQLQNCFICLKSGHRAKDCPDKQNSGSKSSDICLKCGASGHDMFTCKFEYSQDDLKDIQCYVCKSYGHLCCVYLVDSSPRILSCYKCGQLGHTGLACVQASSDSVDNDYTPSSGYNCGEEGHIAHECTSSTKVLSGGDSAGNEYSPILGTSVEKEDILDANVQVRLPPVSGKELAKP